MNIIYFTSAQQQCDFDEFKRSWKTSINQTNQEFHNKLIRALSITNHVDAISIRPFSKRKSSLKSLGKTEKNEDNISWHYLAIPKNSLFKTESCLRQSNQLVKKMAKDSIIIADTINPNIMTIATFIAKSYGMPIIGVCTESPSNIHGAPKKFSLYLFGISRNLDGYICQTPGLNELFNPTNSVHVILEGIVDETPIDNNENKHGDYIFFNGNLLEKYGIRNLIDAFNKYDDPNLKLLIGGHSGNIEELKSYISNNPNIVFLGNISTEEEKLYSSKAWANINPCPYSEDLDRYSLPSRVFNYLNSGSITISSKNSKLYKLFTDEIIWAKNGSVDDIIKAFNKVKAIDKEARDNLSKSAKEKVDSGFSLTAVNKKIDGFLYLFSKK